LRALSFIASSVVARDNPSRYVPLNIAQIAFEDSRMSRYSVMLVGLVVGFFGIAAPAAAKDLLVFAAASLKDALDEADAAWRGTGGDGIAVSYAASSALAKQIEAAAPADIFISADLDWMDYLARRGLIRPESRADLLGNALVLVAPAGTGAKVAIAPGFPLARLLGDGRLAMADPDAVPAGKYGKAALQALGIWDSVERSVASAENVRAALLFVSRKEAPFGIVYRTDATADRGVAIVGTFPTATHPPIIYPIAITAASTNEAAARYVAFLRSPAARPAFEKQGFTVLP
jgi:molybdate transport system substrate-binding protein